MDITDYIKVLVKVKKLVKQKLQHESTGHDHWHCQRVVSVALRIGKEEHADLQVLELAGWLHDIGVMKGRKNHEVRSSVQAEKILQKLHVDQELITKTVACIKNHRFSTGTAVSLEDKILQDADKLDVIGAIGIARMFSFGGKYNMSFYKGKITADPVRYKKTGWSKTIIDHFYDKIFLLPAKLHTDTAKKIGDERILFAKAFVTQFMEEWDGKK